MKNLPLNDFSFLLVLLLFLLLLLLLLISVDWTTGTKVWTVIGTHSWLSLSVLEVEVDVIIWVASFLLRVLTEDRAELVGTCSSNS